METKITEDGIALRKFLALDAYDGEIDLCLPVFESDRGAVVVGQSPSDTLSSGLASRSERASRWKRKRSRIIAAKYTGLGHNLSILRSR